LLLLAARHATATAPPAEAAVGGVNRSSSSSWAYGSSLAHQVARHLGVGTAQLLHPSGAAWDSVVSMRRTLLGSGFHRDLQLHVKAAAAGGGGGGADAGAAATPQAVGLLRGCELSLLQPLPSTVFADPYQLEGLARSSSSSRGSSDSSPSTFTLLGPLDLEL
jgi:hypothetical protein